MADAGKWKGDPEEEDTKFHNSDMDNTKEVKSRPVRWQQSMWKCQK